MGTGLDAAGYWGWTDNPYIGNYGDNSLLYFHQYQNALPGSPLYEGARRGTNVAQRSGADASSTCSRPTSPNGTLPQVSWIVAPEAFSEHPNWAPELRRLVHRRRCWRSSPSNEKLWSQTALFITYDENDGFFDHVVPPTPAQTPAQGQSTVDGDQRLLRRQRRLRRPARSAWASACR